MIKRQIATIAERNRIIDRILAEIIASDRFLLIGHASPDEDCVASMVAFSLLLGKLSKSSMLVLQKNLNPHFQYLVNICRYNALVVLNETDSVPSDIGSVIVFDTPKPSMIVMIPGLEELLARHDIRKIEIDHHLGADSEYIGEEGYRLVDEASSASELVGLFAMKLQGKRELLESLQVSDLFSRNFILAVLTGIIGDSKMGKFLKSSRERWFYSLFSSMFDAMLKDKTAKNSRNFSTMEEVYRELEKLSEAENECHRFLIERELGYGGPVRIIALSEEDMTALSSRFEHELIVTVVRYTTDELAERSGYVGLLAYCEDPKVSDLVQFRMRRSQSFTALDLRTVLERFGIRNGGGHPGAIGFRIPKREIADFPGFISRLAAGTRELIAEAGAAGSNGT
jgi:nanoRNase/pAp phosphatase (c-di-AMP/oligoRNAs hydrolase)